MGTTVVRGAAEVGGGTVVDVLAVVDVVEVVEVVEVARSFCWAFTAAGPDEPQAASTTRGKATATTANEWARRLPEGVRARRPRGRFLAEERGSITGRRRRVDLHKVPDGGPLISGRPWSSRAARE
ncbi:MAG: hypothetical protein ACLQRH_16405 [Acidimicrobiales bacterium]